MFKKTLAASDFNSMFPKKHSIDILSASEGDGSPDSVFSFIAFTEDIILDFCFR